MHQAWSLTCSTRVLAIARQKATGEALSAFLLGCANREPGDPLIRFPILFSARRRLPLAATRMGSGSALATATPSRNCHILPGNCWNAIAGYENPDQIQWIGGGKCDYFSGRLQIAGCAQRFHRNWQTKLLSQKSVHETAAANFAAVLQTAKCHLQLAPLGEVSFSWQQIAEDHPIALKQHPAGGFDRAIALERLVGVKQCPSSRAMPRTRVRPLPCPARRLGSMRERRLSKPSAVTIPPATNSHSAVSTSDFNLPVPRTMSAKNEAPRWRRNSSTCRAASLRPARLGLLRCGVVRAHPVGFLAHEECDRGHAGWNHPAFSSSRILKRRRMGRQAAPAHSSRQAKLIKPLGIIVRNAPAQNLPLPGIGGDFKSLQLSQHIERRALALGPAFRVQRAASAAASA